MIDLKRNSKKEWYRQVEGEAGHHQYTNLLSRAATPAELIELLKRGPGSLSRGE